MGTLAELLGQVPFVQRPMTAGPSMQMNGRDELGNPTMRDVLGQTYMADYSAFEPQQAASAQMANDPRGLRVPDGPVMPRSGTGASAAPPAFVGNIVSALTQGMTTPARAARGEPVTMGDVMSTAMDYGIMGAPMSAPEGALRSTALNSKPFYHGSPDVRGLLDQGGFQPRTRSISYLPDPQAYDDLAARLRTAEVGTDEYGAINRAMADLVSQRPISDPVFASDVRRVAATYADDTRAIDYQNAVPSVLRLETSPQNVLDINANGANFRGLSPDTVRQALQSVGISDQEIDGMFSQSLKLRQSTSGKLTTDDVAAMVQHLGFDAIDVANVRDAYTDVMRYPASNVRMMFDPAQIKIVR